MSVCGNSILEQGEECDDGNRISNDGCDSKCSLEYCAGISVCFGDSLSFVAHPNSHTACISTELICPDTSITDYDSILVDCASYSVSFYNGSADCSTVPQKTIDLHGSYNDTCSPEQDLTELIENSCQVEIGSTVVQFLCDKCPVCQDGTVQEFAGEECEPSQLSKRSMEVCNPETCTFERQSSTTTDNLETLPETTTRTTDNLETLPETTTRMSESFITLPNSRTGESAILPSPPFMTFDIMTTISGKFFLFPFHYFCLECRDFRTC